MEAKQWQIGGLVAVVVLAGGYALWQFRSPPLPGQGIPCQIVCPQGHTTQTTWEAIYALPAANRYQDLSPGGKTTVKCPTCGTWAVVKNLAAGPEAGKSK